MQTVDNTDTIHNLIHHHHEELFFLTKTLDMALHDPKTHLDHIIQFLEQYVITHFDAEEALMQQHQFSGYDYHYNQHQGFKRTVATLRPLYDQNAYTHLMFCIRKLTDKLIVHIHTVDRQLLDLR